MIDRQVISRIAQGSLNTLEDERVMLPATGNDDISALKSILRGLIMGQTMLVDVPPPESKPVDGEPENK